MKLPNGFGSVTRLSGKRRKPYAARVTLGWNTDEENGKTEQVRILIGTYKTKAEALQALAEYTANPYDIRKENMTLAELYQKWSEQYFPKLAGPSSVRTIESAWSYCHPIYNMRVKDLRSRHIKGIINDGYIIKKTGPHAGEKIFASASTKARIKSLFNLMLDYALEYELVDKNYARLFDLSGEIVHENANPKRSHLTFTDDEMQALWDNVGRVRFVDWILIQCYMGWRPQELALLRVSDVDLDRQCITGGMKTAAGRDRTVPIHHRVLPFVENNYHAALSLGSDRLLNDPGAVKGGMTLTYDKYAGRFQKVMAELSLRPDHRPHDPRKQFVTMAKKSGVDEYTVKRIIGHHIDDVTEEVYTERDLDWLRSEIEKIP